MYQRQQAFNCFLLKADFHFELVIPQKYFANTLVFLLLFFFITQVRF